MQGPELNIIINDELRSFVDPLSDIEHAALERSLLAEGCRDALVLWHDTLIDGHNRYQICRKHGIEFRTIQNNSFASLEDVMLWMIDNHLARRSVSDFQRGLLALRKKDIVSARLAQQMADDPPEPSPEDMDSRPPPPWNTREEVAKAARVSSNTISQIERIQKAATPQLVEAVRTGAISINAAANVAQLPQEAQIAAVAGGRKEMQQAARQVREQKSAARPRKEKPEGEDDVGTLRAELAKLKDRLATLLTENERLKQKLALSGQPDA